MEDVNLDADKADSNTKARRECLKCFHLFNCDKTYDLDLVEKLLLDVKDDIRRRLSLDLQLPIWKNYFSLSKMSEMCETTIPTLQMDFAFFVVHAHESRLSINEDNAGIGYAKIYRALLKATDRNVLIVIGGDDNYKDEVEEESSVMSRWARRKVSSQFQEECLDGRESFIFSWNKQHREIHERALLHFLDSNKRGQKFEYQPMEVARGQENEAEDRENNKKEEGDDRCQEQEIDDKAERGVKNSCNTEMKRKTLERPVSTWGEGAESKREEMPNEESQPDSLVDFDLCLDMEEKFEVLEKPEADNTEVGRGTNTTDDETLLMKTRLRYGQISYSKDDQVVWNEQWTPPDQLLTDLANKFKSVAVADLEIYHENQKGAIRVIISEAADNSVIYAMIDIVRDIITWIIDNVRYYISQLAVGSQPKLTEPKEVDHSKEELEMVDLVKEKM